MEADRGMQAARWGQPGGCAIIPTIGQADTVASKNVPSGMRSLGSVGKCVDPHGWCRAGRAIGERAGFPSSFFSEGACPYPGAVRALKGGKDQVEMRRDGRSSACSSMSAPLCPPRCLHGRRPAERLSQPLIDVRVCGKIHMPHFRPRQHRGDIQIRDREGRADQVSGVR